MVLSERERGTGGGARSREFCGDEQGKKREQKHQKKGCQKKKNPYQEKKKTERGKVASAPCGSRKQQIRCIGKVKNIHQRTGGEYEGRKRGHIVPAAERSTKNAVKN